MSDKRKDYEECDEGYLGYPLPNESGRRQFYEPWYNDKADYNTNAPSYYDDLARKQGLIKELANRIWEYDQILAEKLKEVEDTLQHYTDIIDGKVENFDEIIVTKTEKWLSENMEDILTEAVKIVWFGLTDDGYFMAVIPENWSDVQFDTTNEGQLMLIN